MNAKNISLVLSGGGARGLAHIGVIEELEKRGYEIKSICGTSMGAMIGGIYACGKLQEFKTWILNLNRFSLFRLMDISFKNRGLIKGEKIMSALSKFIPDQNIEDLPIEFSAVAADILGRKEVVFNEGSLHEAVRASTSIPTLFTPVQRDGMILTDGGVLNNLPVNHVKKKWRTKIFAVNANAHFMTHEIAVGKEEVGKSAEEMMENPIVEIKTNSENINQNKNINYRWLLDRTLSIMIEQSALSAIEKHPPHLLINIPRTIAGTLDFLKAEFIIEAGKKYASKYLDEFEKKESEGFFSKIINQF